ncbi:phosphate ABC transporter substrate-binding protein [Sphingobacterium sp. ML3W]|uniref:PstS family phosphate ABC transporter substrate-binding protein n=1 Tax=Sphingobacterium sp. ML3W TaxID=1538644 RepID=UPI0004F6ECBA|nr:substrate-binding domain-containing protein [Sphingobacterium sp. ML3W]AIM38646.1 phosphate ABC transporter substrate-binding protein [Sphingobacterium sp. ML3W]
MKKHIFGYRQIFLFPILLLIQSCSDADHAIKMKGSDTEVNLAVNLAEEFSKENADFSIAISGGGSGLGITALLNGQADIANSSRPLTEDEIELFKEKNISLRTVVFAEDATAFVVNKENPLDSIDLKNLAEILDGTQNSWNKLSNSTLPITIYGRQSSSGTYSFVKKKLKISFSQAAKEMTGNSQILESVKLDKSGIGYVGAGYISQNTNVQQGIKVLKIIDKTNTAVSPLDQEAIRENRYYFQRPLFQFIPESSWKKVEPFISFEKGVGGKALIERSGYYVID